MALPRVPGTVLGLSVALVAAVTVAALAFGNGPASAVVDDDGGDGERGVRVVGVGTVSGRPDVLRFTTGVEVAADTVDAALSSANETMRRMIEVLKRRGVAERDMQTAAVEVQPRYDDRGREIVGYVVRESLSVTLRDLEQAGGTMTAAVDAGGNAARLFGVSFVRDEDGELVTQAREAAFTQAKDKAQQYADLAGRELGAVLSIREDVQEQPPGPYPLAAAESADRSVPLEPGSTEIRVSVDVRWALR